MACQPGKPPLSGSWSITRRKVFLKSWHNAQVKSRRRLSISWTETGFIYTIKAYNKTSQNEKCGSRMPPKKGACSLNHCFQCCNVPHYSMPACRDRKTEHGKGHDSQWRCLHGLIAQSRRVYSALMMENMAREVDWVLRSLSLADAIFRILQTKLLIKRQLDPHVSGGHESPDRLNAPGIRVGEVWALDHSFSRHCYDLLLMGILHSCKRKQECLLFSGLHTTQNMPGLNHLDTMELLYIIHLTRAQFYRTGTLLYEI